MCRVCLKRPEVPEERYGRCESCAKNGRVAFRFRLATARGGAGLVVRAGELSPRALRQKWREPLSRYSGHAAAKNHLGLHELELVTARDRIESIRIAHDLAPHEEEALAALRQAAERTDAAW
jgi:hypothetical protein